MQSGFLSSSAAIRAVPAVKRHPVLATGQPVRARPVQRPSRNGTTAAHLLAVAYQSSAHTVHRGRRPRSTLQCEHHQPAHAQVDQESGSTSTAAIYHLAFLLPKLAFTCCLLYVASAVVHIPLLLQQTSILTLAGALLPLQSFKAQRNLARFHHQLQAAAAEAETEEASSPTPVEEEQANDNSVIESGAELGSVQTPASVWLPYNTTKASHQVRLPTPYALCCFRNKHFCTSSQQHVGRVFRSVPGRMSKGG